MFCPICIQNDSKGKKQNPRIIVNSSRNNYSQGSCVLYTECSACGHKRVWRCRLDKEIPAKIDKSELLNQVLTSENLSSPAFLKQFKNLLSKKLAAKDLHELKNLDKGGL